MTRLGWIVLALFTFVAGAFGLLQTNAPPSPERAELAPATNQPQAFAALTGSAQRRPIGDFGGRFTIPVRGVSPAQLVDTWHQAREGGARRHEAIDIVAPGGTPVLAAFAGKVEKLHLSARGGITAYVRSHDGGLMAYYAHLQRYAPGLREGQPVDDGALVGFVGDTGNSGAGNTHLHFALARMRPDEKWYDGEPIDPYPVLTR